LYSLEGLGSKVVIWHYLTFLCCSVVGTRGRQSIKQ